MKYTIRNRILLWWHCLINTHRSIEMYKSNERYLIKKFYGIGCADCNYGEDNVIKKAKHTMRSVNL